MTKEEKEWDSDEVFRLIRMEERLKKLIEEIDKDYTSANAECNDYCIGLIKRCMEEKHA